VVTCDRLPTDAFADTKLALVPGSFLDRCELLCELARGGMGAVWLARYHGKRGFERLVAVKTIAAPHAEDRRFEDMLLDEAQITARVQHPNVAMVIDFGKASGTTYLVMEWVEGESLNGVRLVLQNANASMPTRIALRIMADACAGLDAAHGLLGDDGRLLNVVHRDVSPQNILVGVNGTTKLVDFGIAKARGRVAGETSTGHTKGKVRFMAPEQALGLAVDRRTDVWAIGITLYLLTEGRFPFEADNDLAVMFKLSRRSAPIPMRTGGKPLRDIVEKCLSFEPERRFATAGDLRQALREVARVSGDHASADDLARYLATTMSDRLRDRRRTIDQALSRCRERATRGPLQLRKPSQDAVPTATSVKTADETLGSELMAMSNSSPKDISYTEPRRRRWVGASLGVGLLVAAASTLALRREKTKLLVASDAPAAAHEEARVALPPGAPAEGVAPTVSPSAAPNADGTVRAPSPVTAASGPKFVRAPVVVKPSAKGATSSPVPSSAPPPTYKSVTDSPL